jgi:hypothetical protein
MAEPITPRFHANTVVLQQLGVEFNQTWNGAAWVIDPTTITLVCQGNLADTSEQVMPAYTQLLASDLPPAGQQALQDLWNYLEDQMAAQYT